jgi:hypothetical protein
VLQGSSGVSSGRDLRCLGDVRRRLTRFQVARQQ